MEKNKRSRSPSRRSPSRSRTPSRSTSRSRTRSRSPPRKTIEEYIQESRDPLTKTMSAYLSPKQLSSLSSVSKTFQNISQPQLRIQKAKVYRLAKNHLSRMFPSSKEEFEDLTIDQQISSKINAKNQIRLYEFVYEDDPLMQQVITRMKKLYEIISGESINQ
jgi:hypothetical protein